MPCIVGIDMLYRLIKRIHGLDGNYVVKVLCGIVLLRSRNYIMVNALRILIAPYLDVVLS